MLRESVVEEFYNSYINSKEDETIFTLRGNSMSPTLKDNWKAKLRPVGTDEIIPGDIVVFSQKKLICHRVVGKFRWNKKLYFIHNGDAEHICRVFEEKDLVGKVIEVFDASGNIIDEKIWQRAFGTSTKTKLLEYIYLPLFLTKRLIFGKEQNRFTYLIKRFFWNLYDNVHHSLSSGNIF